MNLAGLPPTIVPGATSLVTTAPAATTAFSPTVTPLSRENKAEILAYLEGRIDTVNLQSWQPGGALVDVYYRKGEDRCFARYFDYADFAQGIEYALYEVTQLQVSTLESFATDKK